MLKLLLKLLLKLKSYHKATKAKTCFLINIILNDIESLAFPKSIF